MLHEPDLIILDEPVRGKQNCDFLLMKKIKRKKHNLYVPIKAQANVQYHIIIKFFYKLFQTVGLDPLLRQRYALKQTKTENITQNSQITMNSLFSEDKKDFPLQPKASKWQKRANHAQCYVCF